MNNQESKQSSRRRFFLWGLGAVTSVSAIRMIFPGRKKKDVVKFLSEDGKLVEVDADLIKKTGVRVSDKDIHTWVKNKPTIK